MSVNFAAKLWTQPHQNDNYKNVLRKDKLHKGRYSVAQKCGGALWWVKIYCIKSYLVTLKKVEKWS